MATDWLLALGLALGSVLWVEIGRDLYHLTAHHWPLLYRMHAIHHRAFRPDLTAVSERLYRRAQWIDDVPESAVMLGLGLALWAGLYWGTPGPHWAAAAGVLYAATFLMGAIARGSGLAGASELTDLTHQPGPFRQRPARWLVNRPYHWRHHFDTPNAYYCSTFALVDKLLGTALSLRGKRIAVTGASGTLGRALLAQLYRQGAKPIALTASASQVTVALAGESVPIQTLNWQVGRESELADQLAQTDILVLNHGINVHGDRSPEAIQQSYEVNTFSSWRLLELFLSTVRTNRDVARKEVWVNTSEAEVSPAFSPLYELSKRALGQLVTLRRLDAPCVVRKIALGPFRSNLNPIGVMSADWVARQIVRLARRDIRNIVVSIVPLTYLTLPLKEFWVSSYLRAFSHGGERRQVAPTGTNAGAPSQP